MTGSLKHAQGALIANFTALVDGSATTILSGNKGGYIINEIQVNNKSGGSVTVTIDIFDGTTVLFELKSSVALANNAVLKPDIDGIPLISPRMLRVTGASGVNVMVVFYGSAYTGNKDVPSAGFVPLGQAR